MHVISLKPLKEFWLRRPDAEGALKAWYHEVEKASWKTTAELKERYPKASIINSERAVFNICSNKYRLVVKINYSSAVMFIRWVGTHAEYDKIDVRKI